MQNLNQVFEVLKYIPFINNGGCGIAALSMYRWLKKNNQLEEDTQFVYMHEPKDKSDYLENKRILKGVGEVEPRSCNHAAVFHKGHYLDAKGSLDGVRLDEYEHFEFTKDESFILASVNNVGQWNNAFERAYIDYIEDELRIDLSDIK